MYTCITEDCLSTLIVYVDDAIFLTNNKDSIQPFINFLLREFQIRILAPTRFLGLNMERDRSSGQIVISQQHTTLNLLEKFGMSNCNSASTPVDPNARLSAFMVTSSEEEKVDMNKIPYSSAVGVLPMQHVLRYHTPLDKRQSTAHLQPAHWKAVKQIFRYLKGTSDFGILARWQPRSGSRLHLRIL